MLRCLSIASQGGAWKSILVKKNDFREEGFKNRAVLLNLAVYWPVRCLN